MSERALEAASESGLILAGEPLLVMLSGGADSVCLLDCALTLGARVSALHGMAPRRGRLVRPLLAATREDTRAHCEVRGLAWVEDLSNTDPRFARARVREEVLPALRELNPAAERAIVETSRLLRDESDVLDAAVDDALARLGKLAPAIGELRALQPGLARLLR